MKIILSITKEETDELSIKEAFKISPDNIEEVIDALPFVKKCVVVGVPDEASISVPMAFIVFKDGYNINSTIGLYKRLL